MSYPKARYHGHTSEATAIYRPADRGPDLTYPSGNTMHYLATGAGTDGFLGPYRWVMGPEPSGPGDFVHVPVGDIHVFRNESGEPADMLLHFAPGVPRESYFEGLITLAEKTSEERYDFFRLHDNVWLE